MSHKHEGHASAHPVASSFSQSSPRVTASDKLLSSQVSLPDNPRVAYVIYAPATNGLAYEALEYGRRRILSRNNSLPFLESVLAHVYVDGDCSALYAFTLTSAESTDASISALKTLSIDGLAVSEASSFSPLGLYPCSSACADQLSPCSACLDSTQPSTASPSSATLLPRKPLRTIYSRFIEAVRNRLIDDIVKASEDAAAGSSAQRLMNGFLLTCSRTSNEWSADWLHVATLRSLVFCQLEVHLNFSKFEIYSHFQPTDYLPLDINLPLAAGTPITLLPFGVPAYYLSAYNGPTSAVTSQFEESLMGLGPGDWKSLSTEAHTEKQKGPRLNTHKGSGPSYIIAWLAVQNKQGEDKGMTIIWPSRLCLSFMAASQSSHARRPLSHLPDIPAQLQSSPPPPVPQTMSVALNAATDSGNLSSTTSAFAGRPISRRLCASPTSESLRAFRGLTLSKSSKVDSVASEVGVYVESVAKEREKERERIRRERENAQISASPRAVATPPTAAPAATAPTPTVGHSTTPGATPIVTVTPLQLPGTLASSVNPAAISNFYPSPPSTNSKSTTQSIDSAVTPIAPLPEPPPPSSQPEPGSTSLQSAFDPFDSMDSSWSQPTNGFMDLGMGYPMGFDLNVDTVTTNGGSGNENTGPMNMDFEDGFTFTEDDFDFFDRPSTTIRATAAMGPSFEDSSGLTPAAGPAPMGLSPSIFGDGQFSGGVAFTPGHHNSSPFNAGNVDVLTSRYSEPHHHTHDMVSTTTGPLLPSPGGTPATPQVRLIHEASSSASMSNFFDPIPFDSTHRLSDSKYDMGKFALPSPPDEEDRTEPIPTPSPPIRMNSWKVRYSAATDPRIGVVRKLIGIKRKSFDQGFRRHRHRSRPSWLQSDEEQDYPVVYDLEEGQSDLASEEEGGDGDDAAPPSRAATPPPAYLPLGPVLLHMQFYHPYLLPLSKPLRPPGAAVAPMAIPIIPTSAPTPVSPAAALGVASEKSKSLEAAGSMIAREVVENRAFADAWRASKRYSLPHKLLEVWPADVSTLAQIIGSVPSLDGPVLLQEIFRSGAATGNEAECLQRLEAPMLSVGKGGCIVQVLPSSLRFWEKLGLTPWGGKKDITAFLFFEDSGLAKQQSAENWLKRVSATYSARQLGSHIAGSHMICSADGILGLRLDSLRKSLVSFLAALPVAQTSLVFYIAIPDFALTLASPLLRQILSTIKRLQKSRPEPPILFQLIPEQLITTNDLAVGLADFENLCFSVYQRVVRPVERIMPRKILDAGEETRGYFRDPPFTLARSLSATVEFNQSGPSRTLDVLDRHTLLHVGYKFSSCGKWLLATCVDQRGESFDVGSWLTQDEVEPSAVLQVWNFAVQFARMANVEWRLVISKLGLMSSNELDAWIHHLSATMPLCRDLPPFQVILLSVDRNVSWSLVSRQPPHSGEQTTLRRSPGKDVTKSIYVDVTMTTTYAIYPNIRIPLPTPAARQWADSSFVPDIEGTTPSETAPILPVSSTILVHSPSNRPNPVYCTLHIHLLHTCKCSGSSLTIPDAVTHQDITRNYHELAVLARLNGHVEYPLLPLHLAALETMHDALRQEDAE